MVKVLTAAEIEELREDGAEVFSEVEKRDVTLDGMSALLEQLGAVAVSTQALVEKRNDDLISAIDSLAIAAGKKEELGPMIQALMELVRQKKEPVIWEHEIERNQVRGTIERIRSAPVKPDLH